MDQKNLDYHKNPSPGKISIVATKPCETQEHLSMAYSPGVADPCLEIQKDPSKVFDYTAKGNMVAVISDGTAVLGLGNIGPDAGIPVMEGKAVLFKRFAGIDSIGICLSRVFDKNGKTDAALVIETVERLEPCFGGINLEDIAAPACFEIEEQLKKRMNIPVFHDDQHGTAIICTAGIINAAKITGRKIEQMKIVINGAGAAGLSCARMAVAAGVNKNNIILCDSKGVVYKGRQEGMTKEKIEMSVETSCRTLQQALEGADVFLGLSVANCVSEEMVRSMAKDPIVFAMANPVPEISPESAKKAGAAIVGTGRSDFPNQVNNVLGFPGIFRGALDTRSIEINEQMKMAAALALAGLAEESFPKDIAEYLKTAYPADKEKGLFDRSTPLGTDYVIPKPFDPRVVPRIAKEVAKAAMESGAARIQIQNLDEYEQSVKQRIRKN